MNTFPALLQLASSLVCEHTLHTLTCAFAPVVFLYLVSAHLSHTSSARGLLPCECCWNQSSEQWSLGYLYTIGSFPLQCCSSLFSSIGRKTHVVKVHLVLAPLFPLPAHPAAWLASIPQSICGIQDYLQICQVDYVGLSFISSSPVHLVPLKDTAV